jgi:uracil phosphoribosyltransferase
MRLLLEKAVSEHNKKIEPPEGVQESDSAVELAFEHKNFCVVVMVRSGNAFLTEALKVLPGTSIGFILV